LPIIHKLFFAVSKGKNRAIPLAEGLGRLYYCGFEVLDLKDQDNLCYIIARKVKEPSTDENPSYSTIIKMKRIGKGGEPIYVYKLRTMHPYSEYLQAFVYQQNNLEIGGKFKNDFRITPWGSIFRKFWIDELPMLINWFKGDCKLVGVRPLSKQYFDLYDNEFRERRIKYKPGLIPPFYADMPSNIVEILKSEKTYLNRFDKNSLMTDFIYFWKSFNNIVINSKRSS
jgi:lipopolysaccharide/colanic/teichoic acid biosynthesis glycosyltransferase